MKEIRLTELLAAQYAYHLREEEKRGSPLKNISGTSGALPGIWAASILPRTLSSPINSSF